MALTGLTDGWDDLGSIGDPRYKGKSIVEADGAEHNECYVLSERLWSPPAAAPSPAPAPASAPASAPALLQLHDHKQHSTRSMTALDQHLWYRGELKACHT